MNQGAPGQPEEETIFSDLWRAKREILDSYMHATKTLAKIQRYASMGMTSEVDKADLRMYVISLYLKIRPLLGNQKLKRSKHKKLLQDMQIRIDDVIMNDLIVELKEIKEWYLNLAMCCKILNIYGVGWTKTDPNLAWKEGLE